VGHPERGCGAKGDFRPTLPVASCVTLTRAFQGAFHGAFHRAFPARLTNCQIATQPQPYP
jgi:hypothetical protein